LSARSFTAVSLFANCGAGDLGYARAGFDFLVMAEVKDRRLNVALKNHPKAKGIPGDLRQTWRQVVEATRLVSNKAPDLLCACPPCQGMSTAKSGRGSASNPDEGSRDSRNLLVLPIAEVARALKPRIIVVENVTAFLRRLVRHPLTECAVTAAALLIEMLEPAYVVYPLVVNLADFGVPQTRRRAFLTFVRKDQAGLHLFERKGFIPYPAPLVDQPGWERKTLEQALRGFALPSLDAVSLDAAVDSERPLHRVPVWDNQRYAMVAAIPPRSGRSAWQNEVCGSCGPCNASPEVAACPSCGGPLLRPVLPNGAGGWRLIKGHRRSSYRRMYPDRPGATVTTASGKIGSDFTIHPWENRVLSPLECALLQTFPADFQWEEKIVIDAVREMIGEAVPPLFTELHGGVLASLLSRSLPENPMQAKDSRQRRALARLRKVA
jgi:DNA (cytosine-5)-methyltransferase 1